MARTDPQINIRIPAELKDQLEASAKANNRTLTSEVVSRLQESLHPLPTIFINDHSGVTAVTRSRSKLTQLAGDLNDLQGKRNTLAMLLHTLKSSDAPQLEINRVADELLAVDKMIADVLTAMKIHSSSRQSN